MKTRKGFKILSTSLFILLIGLVILFFVRNSQRPSLDVVRESIPSPQSVDARFICYGQSDGAGGCSGQFDVIVTCKNPSHPNRTGWDYIVSIQEKDPGFTDDEEGLYPEELVTVEGGEIRAGPFDSDEIGSSAHDECLFVMEDVKEPNWEWRFGVTTKDSSTNLTSRTIWTPYYKFPFATQTSP